MFPLGIAAEKRLRGREASLRHKRSGSRQTWNAGREPLLRQGVGKAGFGSSAVIDAGRPPRGIEAESRLIALECGHSIRPRA